MHSATLSGLSVAATATTRSLGSTFLSFVALNVIYFPLLSPPRTLLLNSNTSWLARSPTQSTKNYTVLTLSAGLAILVKPYCSTSFSLSRSP